MKNKIFKIAAQEDFEKTAFEVFHAQAAGNEVYAKYLSYLNIKHEEVKHLQNIPFLPIEFFRTHHVVTGSRKHEIIFSSSGTTAQNNSSHYVTDLEFYEKSFSLAFNHFYGDVKNYRILALLPGYLEREGSSLIYMMKHLIEKSGHADSGFYLDNYDALAEKLSATTGKMKTLLLGVSFALLDFTEKHRLNLKNTVVMETGGMKGRRKELTRKELQQILIQRLGVENIHSEYGMTELLSQAYSNGKKGFVTPPWMKVLVRDSYDPFSYINTGKTGGINVIDLANINSCSFIETKDLGRLNTDNSFEVLGRFDNSDIRGCNLMVE